MNRPLPLSLAVALALGSSAAHALGLGGVVVKSELNQPLRAEIPVLASAPDEAKGLTVRLASAEDFARVGLSIGSMSVPLSFDISKNARGDTIILVSSDQPVREPFVSFLIEVDWANGRLLREYSVLLDPPVSAPAVIGSRAAVERLTEPEPVISEPLRPTGDEATATATEAAPIALATAPTATAVVPEPEPVAVETQPEVLPEMQPELQPEVQPEVQPEPAPVEPPAPVTVASEQAPASQAPGEYGPVASGETLWEVASITRPNEAVTMNQMLLAMLRANPSAFFQDNVNALKRGAVLRIPTSEEIAAIKMAEAAAEVVAQNRTWIESTQPTLVADAGVRSTLPPLPSGGGSASSRLELVPPAATGGEGSGRPGLAGSTGTAALTAEVARAKESLASSQNEVTELRSRVKELEGINQKSERLIELKNSEMKGLQDRLAAAEKRANEAQAALRAARADADRAQKDSAAKAAAAAAAAVAVTPATSGGAVFAADSSAEPAADTAVSEAESNVSAIEPSPDPTADAAPSTVEVKPLPEPAVAEVAPVDTAAEPDAVGQPWYRNPLFLGAGALVLAILAALGLVSRKRGTKPVSPRSSVASVFDGGVDRSAGEGAQADSVETDLLNALALDPTDLNTHLNVLEYFYTRGDADKFDAAAEAMYGQISDESAPEWQAALLMGMELCPTHPLFSRGVEPPAEAADAFADPGAHGFSAPDLEGRTERWQHTEPHQTIPPAAEFADEFVDSSPPAAAAEPADSFDFNLMEDDLKPQAVAAPADMDEGLSFDFELEKPATAAPAESAAPAPAPPPAVAALASSDDFLGEDAVATKIDLARAYLDMGDSDGARSMLEEVLTEGNASQRAEAKELLAEIR